MHYKKFMGNLSNLSNLSNGQQIPTASKFRNLGFRTQHIYYSPSSQPHT